MQNKNRIYKYDNAKALLIFLVVIGHMTTDYVSDSHMVRWITLWIYTFHMPAFIFLSGLVHRQYEPDSRMRWDKAAGYFLCAYVLKVFLQLSRTLMGQHPLWHWIEEPGIPWYLFVMAEYEILFYLMRRLDGKVKPVWMIAASFALSAIIGYFPAVGDAFCLSRMINFLPIYMIGYYADMRRVLELTEQRAARLSGWAVIVISMAVCYFGPWGIYSLRKWFTGRRSYEYLSEFFSFAVRYGWIMRIIVWAAALLLTFAVISVIPDKDAGYVTKIGSRTLQVYFWHRPLCYLFRTWKVLPNLVVLFGGRYIEEVAGQIPGLAFRGGWRPMLAGLLVYILIGAAMTALFSIKIFDHPTGDLLRLGSKLTRKKEAAS